MIPFRLRREAACMVMVDVQERLLPAISGAEEIRRNTVKLAAAARSFDVTRVPTGPLRVAADGGIVSGA